jgi:glycosyltransferase involved in cell wall biosynthesis
MRPLVSIIINNFNYAKFLPAAIESAIRQTYSPIEILVVDDGSTDDSREVISRHQSSIVTILKRNGGQNSAINAGVKHSRGKIMCFLDADDFCYPNKVERISEVFEQERGYQEPMMVHHLLDIWDDSSKTRTAQTKGKIHKSPCNLYDHAKRYQFIPFATGPTSSISINRALADILFPLPEHSAKITADDYIVLGASLIGELHSVGSALGGYRVHGNNLYFNVDRRKVYDSVDVLEGYLNEKLTATYRLPVISFRHSMYFWEELAKEKHWLTLCVHMVRLLAVQHDKLTVKFGYDTLKQIFNNSLRKYMICRWIAESTKRFRRKNATQSSLLSGENLD